MYRHSPDRACGFVALMVVQRRRTKSGRVDLERYSGVCSVIQKCSRSDVAMLGPKVPCRRGEEWSVSPFTRSCVWFSSVNGGPEAPH